MRLKTLKGMPVNQPKFNPRPGQNGGVKGANFNSDYTGRRELFEDSCPPVEFSTTNRKRNEDELISTMLLELTWEEASEVAEHVQKEFFTNPITTGTIFEEITTIAHGFVARGYENERVAPMEVQNSLVARGLTNTGNIKNELIRLSAPGDRANGRYRLASIMDSVTVGHLRSRMSKIYCWDDCFTAPLTVLTSRATKCRDELNDLYARLAPGAPVDPETGA